MLIISLLHFIFYFNNYKCKHNNEKFTFKMKQITPPPLPQISKTFLKFLNFKMKKTQSFSLLILKIFKSIHMHKIIFILQYLLIYMCCKLTKIDAFLLTEFLTSEIVVPMQIYSNEFPSVDCLLHSSLQFGFDRTYLVL